MRLPTEPIDIAGCSATVKSLRTQSNNLRLLCAESCLSLDLVDQAIAEGKTLSGKTKRKGQGGQWKRRMGPAQSMIFLARAYSQAGDPDYVYATLVKYQRRFGRYIPEEVQAPQEIDNDPGRLGNRPQRAEPGRSH